MNADSPQTPREEVEVKLTALLLGELPETEAAALREFIRHDRELAALHERLKQTMALVRETATAAPMAATAPQPAPLQLSEARRQKLLAHFKTVKPREFAPKRRRVRITVLELAVVLAIIAILAALMLPALSTAKSRSRSVAVLSNLRQIEGAKQQWASEHNASPNDTPTLRDLEPYLGRGSDRGLPSVAGETYVPGKVGEPASIEVDADKARTLFRRFPAEQVVIRAPSQTPGEATLGFTPASTVANFEGSSSDAKVLSTDGSREPGDAAGSADSRWAARRPAAAPVAPPPPRPAASAPPKPAQVAIVLPTEGKSADFAAGSLNLGTDTAGDRFSFGTASAGRREAEGVAGNYVTGVTRDDDIRAFAERLQETTQRASIARDVAGRERFFAGDGPETARNQWDQSASLRGFYDDKQNGRSVASDRAQHDSLSLIEPTTGLPLAADAAAKEATASFGSFGGRGGRGGGFGGGGGGGGGSLAGGGGSVDSVAELSQRLSQPAKQALIEQKLVEPTIDPNTVKGIEWGKAPVLGDVPTAGNFYRLERKGPDGKVDSASTAEVTKDFSGQNANVPSAFFFDGGAQPPATRASAGSSNVYSADIAGFVNKPATPEDMRELAIPMDYAKAGEIADAINEVGAGPGGTVARGGTVESFSLRQQPSQAAEAQARRGNLPSRDRGRGGAPPASGPASAAPRSSVAGIRSPKAAADQASTLDAIPRARAEGRVITALPGVAGTSATVDPEKLGRDLAETRRTNIVLPRAQAGATISVDDSESLVALGDEGTNRQIQQHVAAFDQPREQRLIGTTVVDVIKKRLDQQSAANQSDVAPPKPATPPPIPQPEIQTADNAFSTFSLNVSDVSFKLAAASLEKGQMPDPASIRSEEFINAFDYRDPEPAPGAPIAFASERARYPFAYNRDLLRFSLKTAAAGRQAGRPLNLVLLLDNSGSMERADRVRIIHEALRVLASQLQASDTFSVVTFSRAPRLWVDGLPGNQAGEVAEGLSALTPEGGTNLEEALNLAYATALRHYLANGINRVVLLTDGAANLGNVEPAALQPKVEAYRKQGIALDCFGVGWEGYNDDLLEVLSRNGDGRYGFLNSPEEAATEFAGQLAGALKVAASDVKVQVEFNPKRVTSYRQIGYAKHQLTKEQFRDNTVDAAEIAAQEAGNALYTVEVNPAGEGPLCTVRVRFKVPGTGDYREQEWAVPYAGNAVSLEQASPAMRLAAAASAFSEWLATSPFAGEVAPDKLLGYLGGVPEIYGADARPKKLEWMIRQAQSVVGR